MSRDKTQGLRYALPAAVAAAEAAAAAALAADKPRRRITVASEGERAALVQDAQNRIKQAKKAMALAQQAQQAS